MTFYHGCAVFDRLRQAGLKLSPRKCHFAQQQVQYLGHVVSINRESLPTRPRYWPTPQSAKEVHTFLEMASYYRRYVDDFARIAVPLNYLTRKNVRFQWIRPRGELCFPGPEAVPLQCTSLSVSQFGTDFLLED